MTDPNKTLLVLLVDRSGSMAGVSRQTVDGVNAFLDEQAKADGEVLVTLVTFATSAKPEYSALPIASAPRLVVDPRYDQPFSLILRTDANVSTTLTTEGTIWYRADGGGTALYDSIVDTIDSVGRTLASLPEDERPGNVVVVIQTDGQENSSRRYRSADVRQRIEHQTEVYSWVFTFIGANQDAVLTGSALGVAPSRSLTYDSTTTGTTAAFSTASGMVLRGRSGLGYNYTDQDRSEVTS